MKSRLLVLFFLVSIVPFLKGQFYSGMVKEFGKSRIQHEDYVWQFFDYKKFDIYFYQEGDEFAQYVAKSADKNLKELEDFFEFPVLSGITFIVYNRHGQYLQSNLGNITNEDQAPGEFQRILGSKIFLYYEGSHDLLDKQIRSGVASIVINQLVFGGDLADVVKNAALLNLPSWFIPGLSSYVTEDWSTEIDNRVRDGFISGRFEKFNSLEGDEAKYAGHSFWTFIAQNHGRSVIPNVLYMARASKNIDQAFTYVLGIPMKQLLKEWQEYYMDYYSKEDEGRHVVGANQFIKKTKRSRLYQRISLSPSGDKLLYTTNEYGQLKLWLYDFAKDKHKKVMRIGHKTDLLSDDYMPIIDWHPSGKLFSVIYEKKGKVQWDIHDLEKEEVINNKIFFYEKVLSFDYSPEGRKFVMSAVRKGQTNIYLFDLVARTQEEITTDYFDDLNPRFFDNGSKIIFSSNRTNDTIGVAGTENIVYDYSYDIFVYDLKSKSQTLRRITDTPFTDEIKPVPLGESRFGYLSNENGINNLFVGQFDSTITHIDTVVHYKYFADTEVKTNLNRNIDDYDIHPTNNQMGLISYQDGRNTLEKHTLSDNITLTSEAPTSVRKTKYKSYLDDDETSSITPEETSTGTSESTSSSSNTQKENPNVSLNQSGSKVTKRPRNDNNVTDGFTLDELEDDPDYLDYNNYQFDAPQEEKQQQTISDPLNSNNIPTRPTIDRSEEVETDQVAKKRIYNLTFFTSKSDMKMSNAFLMPSYQRFNPGATFFRMPGLNLNTTFGAYDLFEDYKLWAGFRYGNSDNFEFMLNFLKLNKRFDHNFGYHHSRSLSNRAYNIPPNTDPSILLTRIVSQSFLHEIIFPFDNVQKLQLNYGIRYDKFHPTSAQLSQALEALGHGYTREFWTNATLSYVFDNTRKLQENLYQGTRIKVFTQIFDFTLSVDGTEFAFPKQSHMIVNGVDARHYVKLHKNLIWASRFAAGNSFGPQKLVFYMGGVDDWFSWRSSFNPNNRNGNVKVNESTRVATDKGYAFQTIATNMRGFRQNIRNGNNFAVINTELRAPIFQLIFNRPLKSAFLNNMQLIGFGDLGTAWTGVNPLSEDNSLNSETIGDLNDPNTKTVIKLTTYREPIIAGMGVGIRTKIMGYFTRFDWGWGVEDFQISDKPRFYISLTHDF